MITDQTYNQT